MCFFLFFSKVLIHEGINFDRELYLAILLDRAHNGPVFVASPQGGMDIEAVAHDTPDLIYTQPIDINKGVQDADTKRIAELLGFKGAEIAEAQQQMKNLYELFIKEEATQVEINPFVQTKDGKVFCVDAKILFDDNAAFRHADIHAQRDFSMEDPREVEASKFSLNYIGLDGNIGCMGQQQHMRTQERLSFVSFAMGRILCLLSLRASPCIIFPFLFLLLSAPL